MNAQAIISTVTKAQPPAIPSPPASTNGFLSLQSPDSSSLLNSSPTVGTLLTNAAQPANNNKSNNANNGSDPNATPYIAAPTTPAPTQPVQSTIPSSNGGNQASINGSPIPSNPVLPATDPAAALTAGQTAGQSAGGQATNDANDTSGDANGNGTGSGNSTSFASDVNARVAAGAPIFASQPNTTLATIPPHLLNAAVPQAQAGAAGKAGDDAAQKPGAADASTGPAAATTATGAATPVTTPLHPSHAGTDDQSGNTGTQNDNAPTQAVGADSTSTSDANTASASLVTQPNSPAATPIQVDAAVHTPAPYVPVGEQVALSLKQALATDNNEIRIQLKPASLGTIDVKLNLTQDGRVSAVISADHSDTLNMLKQDSGTLQQSLRDAGLNADSNSLSFNLRGDAQSFAQNSSQGGSGRGGNNGSYGAGGSDALVGDNSPTPSQRFHNGSLNIEV
jgi:hypothetical protein